MIDFEIPGETAALRDEIRAFVAERIVPYETDPRLTRHGPNEALRTELVDLARDAGLLTFQAQRAGSAGGSRRTSSRRCSSKRRAGPRWGPSR